MITTDRDIQSQLAVWLNELTGKQFIKANQSGPAPAGEYGVISILATRKLRDHAQAVEFTEATGINSGRTVAKPVIETEWSFSINFYGADATSILRPIKSAVEMAQTNEPLMPNLIFHEVSDIRNLPEFYNEAWHPRAQIDLHLRGLTRDGVVVDTIEEFSFGIERT